MTQSDQTNDTGAQQSAEAQQSTAEQLKQKAEEVLAAVTPQAASVAAAAQKHFGKVLAWVAGMTKMAPASIRKPWVGALALSAVLLVVGSALTGGSAPVEGKGKGRATALVAPGTPGAVAQAFYKAAAEGNFTAAVRLIGDTEEGLPQLQASQGSEAATAVTAAISFFISPIKLISDAKGGLKQVEVISSNISGAKAAVDVRLYYGNGSYRDESIKLSQINGKWRIGNQDAANLHRALTR